MLRFFTFSHIFAGIIAVLVGFTSSVVLVFQAATIAGASPAEISSWLFALGLSMALSCIGLSWYYRQPILTGWSTAGAAMLVMSLSGFTMAQAIGGFVFAALLTFLVGITGLFEKAIKHVPKALSAAMLAGILLRFGIGVFTSMQEQPILVGAMFITYLLGKNFLPRYVIPLVVLVAVLVAQSLGLFSLAEFHVALATPKFVFPEFSIPSLMSIGIPLFIVTMTSQNIPGVAALHSAGYHPPVSAVISWIGLINALLAPFGSFSISLAAMTAAICTGHEVDHRLDNRYKSTLIAGLCWLLIGLFGATIVTLFSAFPKALITALAGIALLGTIGTSMKTALEDDSYREPALITMLVSASGISVFGISAVFWGLIAGVFATFFFVRDKKPLLPLEAKIS